MLREIFARCSEGLDFSLLYNAISTKAVVADILKQPRLSWVWEPYMIMMEVYYGLGWEPWKAAVILYGIE